MNPATEELIRSVNNKMDLLLLDDKEFKRIILGENGSGGLVEDVHTIKKELVGDPEFKKEGLIEIVQRHDQLFKKMQNMSSFAIAMISIGVATGGFFTWVAHNIPMIKKIF